jgi:long-chain acyl-CoA synthetase
MPDIAPQDAGPGRIREWIDRAARLSPDKPYIVSVEDGRAVSFAEFRDLTRRIGAFLQREGIGTNDRIALFSGNSIEHVACYVGVMAYGATICTVHVEMNRRHLGRIVRQLRPRLILYDESVTPDELMSQALWDQALSDQALSDQALPDQALPDQLLRARASSDEATSLPAVAHRAVWHDLTVTPPRLALGRFDRPEPGTLFAALDSDPRAGPGDAGLPATGERDDAVIFFTSGTSEKPKGVVLSYREQVGNIEPMADGFGISGADRIYDYRSFNWASAQLLGVLAPLARGATLVMARKFSASRFFDDLRAHRVTIAAGNPTVINMLLNTDIAIGPPPATCRACASSPRARRRCCRRCGGASRRVSAFRWRRAMAPARPPGSPSIRDATAASAASAGRSPITASPSSMRTAARCRRARSAMSSSAPGTTTNTAISTTTAPCG